MTGTRADVATRLWRRVQKTDTCWIWTGGVNKSGYGIIGVSGGQTARVHASQRKLRSRLKEANN